MSLGFWTPFSVVFILTICLVLKFCCNYEHHDKNEERVIIYNHKNRPDVNSLNEVSFLNSYLVLSKLKSFI